MTDKTHTHHHCEHCEHQALETALIQARHEALCYREQLTALQIQFNLQRAALEAAIAKLHRAHHMAHELVSITRFEVGNG